jgi:hypothetical protein
LARFTITIQSTIKRGHIAKQKVHVVKISQFGLWQKEEGWESGSNKRKKDKDTNKKERVENKIEGGR